MTTQVIYTRYTHFRVSHLSVKLCVSNSRPFGTKPFFAASSWFPGSQCFSSREKNSRSQAKEAIMVSLRPASSSSIDEYLIKMKNLQSSFFIFFKKNQALKKLI